jgi:hypothetical protein
MPDDFEGAFNALREMLRRHAQRMVVQADTPKDFVVATRALAPNGRPMWFGCVSVKKTAVTYHLMPLYFNPKLQAAVPPKLLARKQGKTCFNFKRPDPALFEILDDLTRHGREAWERQGLLDAGPIALENLDAALRAGGENPEKLKRLRKTKVRQAAKKRAATVRAKAAAARQR